MINEIQPKIKFQNIVQCSFNNEVFGNNGLQGSSLSPCGNMSQMPLNFKVYIWILTTLLAETQISHIRQ